MTAFTRNGSGPTRSFYLIFEWADGGNLENVYERYKNPSPSVKLSKLAIKQLLGISEALAEAHENKIRHGDLKPGNILCFMPTEDNIFGTLKIGDWGLAKFHSDATTLRGEQGIATTTKYGTPLYEPPEVELGDVKILGRQYDVWSMGCVIMELVIWLLYGHLNIQKFRGQIKGNLRERVPCYETRIEANQRVASLRPSVVDWMDHISKEPICGDDTILGNLLELVRTQLLIVPLPPDMGQPERLEGDNLLEDPATQGSRAPKLFITSPMNDNNDSKPLAAKGMAYRITSKEEKSGDLPAKHPRT
ncbi:hypothetical protein SLS62_005834 [Diatrype stigma]|uniref:Protein kinase domain-containing protein n=1 Tax=Diatrype stigma TaxID=117547 RepID=A0AAN9YNB6_9PEZI